MLERNLLLLLIRLQSGFWSNHIHTYVCGTSTWSVKRWKGNSVSLLALVVVSVFWGIKWMKLFSESLYLWTSMMCTVFFCVQHFFLSFLSHPPLVLFLFLSLFGPSKSMCLFYLVFYLPADRRIVYKRLYKHRQDSVEK